VFNSVLLHTSITLPNSLRYIDLSGQPVIKILCLTKYSRRTC